MSDIRKSIGWADWSWNPVWGCLNKCPYCYARNIAKRFGKQICGRDDFVPVWIEKNFQKPIPKYATHVFVNSMSDIQFWDIEWFSDIINVALKNTGVKFLMLTKRQTALTKKEIWVKPVNLLTGTTITKTSGINEDIFYDDFISIEPIQEKIDCNYFLKLKNLKQIIVGAETGNRKGKIIPKAEWIEEISKFCQKNGIKLFEKDSLMDIVKRDLIQEKI